MLSECARHSHVCGQTYAFLASTLVKPLPNLQQAATLHCTAHIVHNKAVPSAL